MSHNSQYMRSVNDYSLSAHELFTRESGQSHPSETRVFVIKNIPELVEFDKVKAEIIETIRANSPELSTESNYNIQFRDTLKIDMESYSIYGQEFIVRTGKNISDSFGINISLETLVAEVYRRSDELILIILANVPLNWLDAVYENIQTRYPEIEEEKANTFYTISRNQNGFELQSMELETVYDEKIIDGNYNDSFRETWELTTNAIDNDKRGLILLHGVPGSGKSHILKQIIARGGKRKIVYIPSYLATSLSDPAFIGFVRKQMSNAVLVIEDGEDVLVSREIAPNPAVTNILQISDGILGDALNMLIISTFNTDLQRIDAALQRKGRMIAEYKFDELDIVKAEALAEKLFGEDHNMVLPKELTLANIFTMEENQPKTVIQQRKIGF